MLPFSTTHTTVVDKANGIDDPSRDGDSSAPWRTVKYAIQKATQNTTIIIKNGIFYRNEFCNSTTNINYNFNFIAENEHTLVCEGDNLEWTQNDTYSNIYQATRSGGNFVIDIRNRENGIYSTLEKVNSLSTCASTLNSYYLESNIYYVNIGEVVTSEKIVISLTVAASPINLQSSSGPINIYFENIDFICGTPQYIDLTAYNNYIHELHAYKTKFLFCSSANYDGFSNRGCKSILYKCEASNNLKDGFNYHTYSNNTALGIEVDCIAGNNGFTADTNNNNGSTAHDGCAVLRINGIYYNNRGGNVADVNSGTITENINCKAFDSLSSQNGPYNTDFVTQQSGSTMYLINCDSISSTSNKNIYAVENSTIYLDNTEYETSDGEGNIIDLNE